MFTGTVPRPERAQFSLVATKGSCVVGLVWPDKIGASEEVWCDCYKGAEVRGRRSGLLIEVSADQRGLAGELRV